jgi:hypothetical protein
MHTYYHPLVVAACESCLRHNGSLRPC